MLYANRVHEACSASGIQNLALLGALTGKATFTSKIPTGSKVPYVLLDGNGADWEVGIGTLSSASELQRTTIIDSSATSDRVNSESAGTPIKLSLSSNQHEVFISTSAQGIFSKDENGEIADPSALRASLFVDTIADMTAMTGLEDGETVIVKGGSALADGDGGIYYWDASDAGAESPPSSYEHDSIATGLFKRIQLGGIDADALLASAIDTATDLGGVSASNSKVPSQLAVKTALNNLLAANDAEVLKGAIDCSTNPNYPAADAGHIYRVSVAGKIGGASGVNVEANDRLECVVDSTASGTQAGVGANWMITQVNLDGAVIGPGSATDNDIARYDGVSGKLIKAGLALDNDTALAADSATKVATQHAVKTYIDGLITALKNGVSTSFDTLKELADGLALKLDAVIANNTYFKGRNAANSADKNLLKINAQDFIEFGSVISADNYGSHTNRGAFFRQITYANLAPTVVHYADWMAVVGKGDNTGFKGVGGMFIAAIDDPSVDTDGERGVLYGVGISCQPARARNNAPHDDVACLVGQNDGTAQGTEMFYAARGANALTVEWIAGFGIACNAEAGIWMVAAFGYGIDFSRGLASPATFTGAAIRIPNNVTAITARNAANNADVAMVGFNSSDQLTLSGKVLLPWTAWTPIISATTGTITTASVNTARYYRFNNTVFFLAVILVTTKGTGSGALRITLPVQAAQRGVAHGRDLTNGYVLEGNITAGSSNCDITFYNASDPLVDGDYYVVQGFYEV